MSGSAAVRVGGTLRRPAHARSEFVGDLLRGLRDSGFTGAPLALGYDEAGRQVFEWVDGEVPLGTPYRLSPDQLRACGRLMADFHDAAARLLGVAGDSTVEHGDLGPHNTVFRSGAPVALIDWDEDVRPGSRLADVAQGIWGYADLLEDAVPVRRQAAGLATICAAYAGPAPEEVLDALGARFDRALADHREHGRTAAVDVFAGLRQRLDDVRPALLDAGHRTTAGDG